MIAGTGVGYTRYGLWYKEKKEKRAAGCLVQAALMIPSW